MSQKTFSLKFVKLFIIFLFTDESILNFVQTIDNISEFWTSGIQSKITTDTDAVKCMHESHDVLKLINNYPTTVAWANYY